MPAPNARAVCLLALQEWEQGRQFADDILHELVARHRLPPIDRAFLTEVFYGILRNRARVDYLIERLGRDDLDVATHQVLRLGVYQIFHMRVPDHAAVNETVELAGRARKLVNALLRRGLREQRALIDELESASMAVQLSHPEFLVNRWVDRFGAEATKRLCEWNNSPAEIFIRVNTLKITPGELQQASPQAQPVEFHPLAFKVTSLPFLWIANGLCYVQDPSTLVAPDLLAPQAGESVLDACAAPGGKGSYIAAMMGGEGRLVMCDNSLARLGRLKENLEHLGITKAEVAQENWLSESDAFKPATFDRILFDAPCTNTGVIRRRIDVRWRLTPEDFSRMAKRQFEMLTRIVPLLKKGGTFVYSTCSLEPEENEGVVERVTKEFPELRLLTTRQTLPFRDEVDGAFAASFSRT